MKRKKNINYYFAEREEQAVIDYIKATTFEEKNRIYNDILLEPFKKMIQSILRKYPTHLGNYEMSELEQNALIHLIDHMVQFDENKVVKSGKKTKAFSYCQTIVRNYFRDHSKKTYNDKKVILPFDDYIDEINDNIEYQYEIKDNNEYYKLDYLINNIIIKFEEKLDDPKLKKNEVIVGEAVINILKNWNVLFLEDSPAGKYDKEVTNKFAKNKILLFLKEQSNLSTKEIRVALKPFKEIYLIEKSNIFED